LRKKPAGRYHHGGLRRALLDATLAIVAEGGTGAVSLSAAARKVGVSPQASYNHFRDKAELLAAAAEEGVRALERALREARDGAKGPGERLEAAGVAYVEFACARAAQFRLLGAPEIADKSEHPALLAAYEDALRVLLEAIGDCQRAGVVRKGDPRALATCAWATVHGLAWLLVDGQISAPDAGEVAQGTVRVLFRGLRQA
jgi:AcrR family transcriptional regulator